jgi:hypothetical protein
MSPKAVRNCELDRALKDDAAAPGPDFEGKLYEAESDLRHFRDSLSALRAELEKVRFEKEDAIQIAVAEANSENAQVRQTVSSLRDAMEKLGGIVVPNHRVKTTAVGGTGCEGYSSAHAQDSHVRPAMGIPNWTRPLGGNH